MDLLQTVRKEGSRGGVNFSWDDVKSSNHRENYLGHSLKAPVGRWQKNKDLSWYAKADDAELTPEQRAEKERERKREEMKKIKEAEEDAMARALGLPVPDRTNANLEPLGEGKISQKEVDKALRETLDEPEYDEAERGVGFGKSGATAGDDGKEIMRGTRRRDERRRDRSKSRERRRDYDDDDRSGKRQRRSRSRSRDRLRNRERRQRHHRHRSRSWSRSRSRSRSRDRKRRSRSRNGHRENRDRRHTDKRSRSRDRERKHNRSRSRSPYEARRGRRVPR